MSDVKGSMFLFDLRQLLHKYGGVNMYATWDGTVMIQVNTEEGRHQIAELNTVDIQSIKTHLNGSYGRGA